jgi:cytoskeleton protein RodZ
MSAHLAPNQDDDAVVEMKDGPGHRLRVARQARGLDVERVAAELHLAPDLITALEQDDYDALPGHVFTMGYMRNYARLLMLDPEPLLDAYRGARPEAARPPRVRLPKRRQADSNHPPVKLVSLALSIAAAALAYAWWDSRYGDTGEPEAPAAEMAAKQGPAPETVAGEDIAPVESDAVAGDSVQVEAPAPTLSEQEQAEPAPDPAAMANQSPVAGQAPNAEVADAPAAAPAETAEPEPEPEPEPENLSEEEPDSKPETSQAASEPAQASPESDETPAPAVAAGGEIVLSFSGPCWVDVRDSTRDFKLFGEMAKGDQHVLGGTPPYSVILGNTAAVTITVGGAHFDVDAIARGNVARFTLDPAQIP